MIAAVLSAFALQSTLITEPAVCTVGFGFEQRRPANITVDCPSLGDQSGAESEIRRQLEGVQNIRVPDFMRGFIPENRVVVFGVHEGEVERWYATSQPVLRTPPNYPSSAVRSGMSASCAVRFHLSEGEADVIDVVCNPDRALRRFRSSASDAVRRWSFTRGLPVPCNQTVLDYSVGPAFTEHSSPDLPDCDVPDDLLEMFPEAIQPYASQIANLLEVVPQGTLDQSTGKATCALFVAADEVAFTCPENAPELQALNSRIQSQLDLINLEPSTFGSSSLADHVSAQYDEVSGWTIAPLQPILIATPGRTERMSRRRAEGFCRAGVTIGSDGRAVSSNYGCVISINPRRFPEILSYVEAETRRIVGENVWLPPAETACVELDVEFKHADPLYDRGVSGTSPDELPVSFCHQED